MLLSLITKEEVKTEPIEDLLYLYGGHPNEKQGKMSGMERTRDERLVENYSGHFQAAPAVMVPHSTSLPCAMAVDTRSTTDSS